MPRALFNECRQYFTVYRDTFLFECMNEGTVGETEVPNRAVDDDIPESPEVTLLVPAMGKGVGAGVDEGFVCHALFG